ncbi:hypothetical protein ACSBR1_019070 [Camellia fascicularis]
MPFHKELTVRKENEIFITIRSRKFGPVLSLLMAETIAVIGAAGVVMQAVSQAKPIFGIHS